MIDYQLRFIEQENEVVLKRSEECFLVCKKTIEQLKTFIIKYKFKSVAEEIKFFTNNSTCTLQTSNRLTPFQFTLEEIIFFIKLNHSLFCNFEKWMNF